MKIADRLKSIGIPSSARRDAIFLPPLFVFNCFSFSSWAQLSDFATKPWLLLAWLYGLVSLVPLAWRDKAPLTVFALQCVLTVAAWPFYYLYVPMTGIPVALYAVTVRYSVKVSLLALLFSVIINGLAAASFSFRVYSHPGEQMRAFAQNVIFLFLVAIGAWTLGRATQASKQRVQDLENQKKTAQEAVAEERKRLAAELHDIVCHAVTLIILQAAGAAKVAKTASDDVIEALANIQSKGNQAMAELERLLGVLRGEDATADTTGANGLRPQPGLADLPKLLESFPAHGSRITQHVQGVSRELDPSVELAAFRIVQEGLLNVVKHAGEHASPQLRLSWQDDTLTIEIDNGANLAKANHKRVKFGGRGLVGLRERVHAVGGELVAGPLDGAGYRLTATLPLAEHARVPPATVLHASSQVHSD